MDIDAIQESLEWLGRPVEDKVTKFKGIVASVSFDLYGCISAVLTPEVDAKNPGELSDSRFFDLKRLQVIGKGKRVMELPSFERVPERTLAESVKGPAEKPKPQI